MKQINKKVKKIVTELFKIQNILFILFFSAGLSLLMFRSRSKKESALNNAFETKATILGFDGCYNNGRCVNFSYEFRGSVFIEDASVSIEFAAWCAQRDDCKGKTFKLIIDTLNPSNRLVFWQELMNEEN